ncbi:MAG: Type 1 glutamine amidotransferase-like domain-containing protein [Acidimicrobiia bacterium]
MDAVTTFGPVALVGSGEFTPAMSAVDRLLLEGRSPRVVFLPTAAGPEGPERVSYWVDLGRDHYHGLGAEPVPLLVLDRPAADDPDLAARVEGAGLVYLSGGNPEYLAATLAGTRVLDAILAAWKAGAALAGCSAGACALTAAVFGAGLSWVRSPGLAVIPGVVVLPHFDAIERWWPDIVGRNLSALEPGEILVGIDESTALVGGPDRFEVHGAGAAWVVDEAGRVPHPAGAVLDLRLAAPHP